MGTDENPQISATEDFEILRAENNRIGDDIARASLIRLVLLLLVTFLFLLGMIKERNTGGTEELVQQIREAERKYNPHGSPQALDPFTLLFQEPAWQQVSPVSSDSPSQGAPVDLNALGRTLRQKYNDLFDSKLSFVGADIHVDLRILIITLPLWLLVAYIYIHVLHYKHQALAAVCQWRFQNSPRGQLTTLDQLLFAESVSKNPYRLFPAALRNHSFWIAFVVLIFTIADITWSSLKGFDVVVWLILLNILAAAVAYSSAYCHSVGKKLARQIHETFGCPVPQDWIGKFWERSAACLGRALWQKRPRFSLTLGSLLILATLFLNSAEVGCKSSQGPQPSSASPNSASPATGKSPAPGSESKYKPGYTLLTGEADWPTSVGFIFDDVDLRENVLGRAVYAAALAMAVSTLICAGMAFRSSLSPKMASILVRVAVVISLYLITNYSSKHLLGLYKVWVIPWTLTALGWLALAQSHQPRRIEAWRRVRETVVLAFVPICFASLTYMGSVIGHLPGLTVLYVGVHLVALGWLRVAGAENPHGLRSFRESSDGIIEFSKGR